MASRGVLGMSLLDWVGLLFFAFSAVVLFLVFAPPAEPSVNVQISGATARFELSGNLLSLLRVPSGAGSVADLLVSGSDAAGAVVASWFSLLYPDSAWFVRLYPARGSDGVAFADAHGGRPFVEVAGVQLVETREGQRRGCADLDVDALLADADALARLAPLALAEVVLPSKEGPLRVVACEVRLR